jgi:CHAT domain-containing protein/Tfp pilus assembly protein PilF
MRQTRPKLDWLVVALLCLLSGMQLFAVPDAKQHSARQEQADTYEYGKTRAERQELLRKLNEALPFFLNADNNSEATRTLNRKGRLQLLLNEPNDAIESFQQALVLLKKSPAVELEIDSCNGLGASYVVLQDLDRAEKILRRALLLSEESGYTAGKAQALLTLSNSQNYSNHALALETAQAALPLWETLGDKQGLARTLAQAGRCYMAQNILPEATAHYERAVQIWREQNNPSEQAGALIMLGFIEYRKAEWQNSISYLTQAQGLIDEASEPLRMGQIAAGLAEAFNESGLPEIGLGHFQRALEYYRRTKNPHLVMIANRGLGITYCYLKDYPQALTHFQQALEGVGPNTPDAAQNYEHMGLVYGETGQPELALKYLQSALVIYRKAVNPRETAQVLALLAKTYQQQGQVERARGHYQEALETFTRLSDRLNESAVFYGMGRLELKAGNIDVAEKHLQRSIAITEDMRRVSGGSDLAAAFSATVYERYQSYIECLMRKDLAHPGQGFAGLALETSELARARALAQMLSSTATSFAPGVDPQLVAQEKSLRQDLRVKENNKVRLLGGKYTGEQLALLEGELTKLEQQYKQVTQTIQARYPAFEKLTHPGGWRLQQIQTQVITDDQTVLLEYSLGADRSYVWAITRGGLASYELPSQQVITKAAQKVYALLANAPSSDTEGKLNLAAHELSDLILSPAASQLNRPRIIVVADGALNYIPFQLLPAPNSAAEQLVASHEIINAPSASVLGQLRQETSQRRRATNVLAAFGDPVFPSNFAQQGNRVNTAQVAREIQPTGDSLDTASFEQLFFAKLELANLRGVAGDRTLLATRFDATPEKLRNTDLTRYAILHLATHGILDPKRPERSGLVLSTINSQGQPQNGFVGLQDIYSLHAPVDLVVLSACRTGLGKDVRGEGLIGLTRGFMYAGASSVVASLWKVDDEATAELMKRFYTNMLRRGMRPPEALRAAQNSIRQEPQWRAPYYWAAFTLQGDYLKTIELPVNHARTYQRLFAGIVCLLFLAAGVWWLRRERVRYSTAKR